MIVSMKKILDHANENHYAVMAINCINLEMVRAAISAAEKERSSIIINLGQGQMQKHAHIENIMPIINSMAKDSLTPVAINLDHGTRLEVEINCINKGFTNVMFDGSSLPYEENVKKTKLITDIAHMNGVSVEAEIGHVGQVDNEDYTRSDFLTDPDIAKDFVERTGVDCLAIAIGTAHGLYPENYEPVLDFDRLEKIKDKIGIPLVLHGGSGSGDENIKRAVSLGINKINVCSDAFKIAKETIIESIKENESIDYLEICMRVEAKLQDFISEYIKLIGSANQFVFNGEESNSIE